MTGDRLASWIFGTATVLLVLLLALLTGCAFSPPDDAVAFNPPPEYRAVWDSAQACTGKTGRFDDLRFYLVPDDSFKCSQGDCAGHVRRGENEIYLAEPFSHTDDSGGRLVIKHEMIHILIRSGGHPYHPFVAPCRATWESAPLKVADASR